MRHVFSAHSTDDTLDPEWDLAQWPIKGVTSLSALVCLPGSATWLSCPCYKVVWMQVSSCSQQGFVLAYWCWHPSVLLPASPQFDGCNILTHTGEFSLKMSLKGSCVNWRIPNRLTFPSGLRILSWRDCFWDNAVNIHSGSVLFQACN